MKCLLCEENDVLWHVSRKGHWDQLCENCVEFFHRRQNEPLHVGYVHKSGDDILIEHGKIAARITGLVGEKELATLNDDDPEITFVGRVANRFSFRVDKCVNDLLQECVKELLAKSKSARRNHP